MDRETWKPFLKRWSEEWLAVHDVEPRSAFEEPVVDGWLGSPPASAEQVAEAEARLGCTLPPSLREFLLTTDGWRNAGNFVWLLRGADDIGWLRDLDSPWAADCADIGDEDDDEDEEDDAVILRRSLQISLEADAGVLFLDPADVDEHGEWAAYELFTWTARGPERHGSFSELMYDLYAGFHALDRPQCQTQREWDAAIEHARLASLAGEVDGPMEVFAEAARFGRDRAGILLFQMQAMLGDRDASRLIGSMLWRGIESTWPLDAPFLEAEVLPVLFAEHKRAARWSVQSTFVSLSKHGSEPVQKMISDYRASPGEPRFGNPEFDAAVRAAITAPTPDDAWTLLRKALSAWRPMSDDHLAPIVLLADPRTARLITPERGREILAMRRG
ncbi:SMI1/KNR4 family protein [Planomonospora sp. ID91781]|uniref:SMI1/KNR4 family protein n=1 Tax=Planomonospora sp. ID91781 TaxID=2738135 RepID=UPI0018C3CBDF|nr:SMI1/KNR4 family protein [Planomonospora sp. ID91781]MBG0825744.1 SMI1/KNR4 family protein [Planomonospora sp. ID91781]